MQPILEIRDLSIEFHSGSGITKALQHVSLTVDKGEIVALVGESGSGKSITSLSILQLLPTPPAVYSSGQIIYHNEQGNAIDLLKTGSEELRSIRGNSISMIFQEPMTSLNPVISCGKQITEAIRAHKKISEADAKKIALNWFEQVRLPDVETIFRKYPHELSGGQKQRVMIAMAMCCEPALLICDEPTTALDVSVQKTILELIKNLQRQTGMSVIFITHDLGVVAEVADRAIVLYKGSVIEENSVHALFNDPQHPYTKGLLACRPILHRKGERLPVVADFIDGNVPTTNSTLPDPVSVKEANNDPLIVVKDLSVHFSGKKALFSKTPEPLKAVDKVSFEVRTGETMGLVGESGCGKTTLGRALLRLIKPTEGVIQYKGKDLSAYNKEELASLRKDIQIVFQDPYSSLNPRISIGAAIAEPMKVHRLFASEKQRRDKTVELLEKVDLNATHLNRYPHEFSGGQRQRIVIARALALQPSFIVCDESVSALDVSVQAQVLNLLNDLKKEFGFTVVFISHDLAVVRYISDRIIVMNKGHIEEMGDADEIYLHPKSDYTKRLINAIPRGVAS